MQKKQAKTVMEMKEIPKMHSFRKRNSNDPLTKEEVARLISSTTSLEDRTLFILGFNTGMRVSEVVNIPWISIDWKENKVMIWDEKKDRYRNVMLDSYTLSALKLWHNECKRQEKVFEFTAKTVQNRLQYWSQKVLGKKKSWHCVRHTYITLQVIAGTPVSIVGENTGDCVATIYRYYTQIPPQKKMEFVERGVVFDEKAEVTTNHGHLVDGVEKLE